MRKQRKEYEAIPASLENAIEGMSITPRGMHEDEERVVLLWAGEQTSSFYHSEAETSRRILAGWPHLSQGQLNQAMRSIRGRIRAALKAVAPAKRGWMDY